MTSFSQISHFIFHFFTAFARTKHNLKKEQLAKLIYTFHRPFLPLGFRNKHLFVQHWRSQATQLLRRHDVCSSSWIRSHLFIASAYAPSVRSLCLCINDHLASEPFIILSFLQEEMNILQTGKQVVTIRLLFTTHTHLQIHRISMLIR